MDEKKYSLEIFDTAGSVRITCTSRCFFSMPMHVLQDEFSSMRDRYIRDGHGFVLVYSITSQATFNELNAYYERIISLRNSDTGVGFPSRSSPAAIVSILKGVPAIILVGNKCDLSDERAVKSAVGQNLAREWNCSFFETSAKDRTNVPEVRGEKSWTLRRLMTFDCFQGLLPSCPTDESKISRIKQIRSKRQH